MKAESAARENSRVVLGVVEHVRQAARVVDHLARVLWTQHRKSEACPPLRRSSLRVSSAGRKLLIHRRKRLVRRAFEPRDRLLKVAVAPRERSVNRVDANASAHDVTTPPIAKAAMTIAADCRAAARPGRRRRLRENASKRTRLEGRVGGGTKRAARLSCDEMGS